MIDVIRVAGEVEQAAAMSPRSCAASRPVRAWLAVISSVQSAMFRLNPRYIVTALLPNEVATLWSFAIVY